MRNMTKGVVLLLGALSFAGANANESEDCAVKAQKAGVKGDLATFKAVAKICRGLDDGAQAAFDAAPAGDGNNDVEGDEMDDADFDFDKLREKINKAHAKGAAIIAEGGTDCEAHFDSPTLFDPLSLAEVQDDVASGLGTLCF